MARAFVMKPVSDSTLQKLMLAFVVILAYITLLTVALRSFIGSEAEMGPR